VVIGAGKSHYKHALPRSSKTHFISSPFKSWQRIYSYDLAFNLTESESKNILGGEVCLWTEQVDATTLDTRLW
jgi:hypothetical protein